MTKLLFAPGPVKIPDKIKFRMLTDPPYFTTSDFSKLLEGIQNNFNVLLNTTEPVLIGTGSGSLGMEVVVQNFFSRDETVVIVDTGKYGKNWSHMCSAYGVENVIIESKLGKSVWFDGLVSILKSKVFKISGILVTHVETTSVVKNDIAKIKQLRDTYVPDALICVDAVSSLFTESFEVSEYDVVVSASQKALQCPPGLFFLFINQRALEKSSKTTGPRFYFSVPEEYKRAKKYKTTFTPASTTIVALDETLKQIIKIGGTEKVIEKAKEGSEIAREILKTKFQLIGNGPNALTGFYRDGAQGFASYLDHTYDLVIGTGVRENADTILRMMHFGWDLNLSDVKRVATILVHASDPYP